MKNSDSTAALHLVRQLYESKVVLSSKEALELEIKTRQQASSELWHGERKLRITASVMKEVCHRKVSISCTAFVQKKPRCYIHLQCVMEDCMRMMLFQPILSTNRNVVQLQSRYVNVVLNR